MKSYIVLGLGRFGKSFARTLVEMGHQVLGVDDDEKNVQELADEITHVVQADASSEEFLRSIDVKNFDAAIVAIASNIQSSIITTVVLKELGAKFILAKAQNDLHAKVLYKIGADKVILPERDMGIKAAHNLVANNFYDMIEISSDYSIIGLTPPSSWIGRKIGELAVRTKYGVNIIAIKNGDSINVSPNPDTVIHKNDTITMMGANTDLKRVQSIK